MVRAVAVTPENAESEKGPVDRARDGVWDSIEEVFAASSGNRAGADVGSGARIARLLSDLHTHQWDLEAACRLPITDAQRGSLKTQIDASNARRIELINAIDDLAAGGSAKSRAVTWPLTLGQTVDTLLILLEKLTRLPDNSSARVNLAHSVTSMSGLATLIRKHHVVFPPKSTIKDYSAPRETAQWIS